MSEGHQKRKTVYSILGCRLVLLLILLLAVLSKSLVLEEFLPVLYIILPLSFFYIALSVVFIVKNKYLLKGRNGNPALDLLAYRVLLLLYVTEIGIIIYKAAVNWLTSDTLDLIIALMESLFAIHAGLYLVYLFAFPKAEIPDRD